MQQENKKLLSLAFALIGMILLTSIRYRVYCDDHWWHMLTGRFILENGAIPTIDPFSFTHAGSPWVNWEWLAGLVMYAVYSLLGPSGLQLLRLVLVGGTLILIWKNITRLAHSEGYGLLLSRVFVMPLVILVLACLNLDRPHSFGYLFTALAVMLSYSLAKRPAVYKSLSLLALVAVWTQMHPSWMLGVLLIIAILCEAPLAQLFSGDKTWLKNNRLALISALLQLVLALALKASGGYSHSVNSIFQASRLFEWQSLPELFSLANIPLVAFVFMSMLWLALAAINRHSLKSPFVLFQFAAMILGFVYFRFTPYFAIMACPQIVVWLAPHFTKLNLSRRTLYLAMLFLAVGYFLLVKLEFDYNYKSLGWGLKLRHNPQPVVEFMRGHELSGNLMSNWLPTHGYLAYQLWPDSRVFIDGRIPQLFSLDFLELYSNEKNLHKILDKYPVDFYVMVTPTEAVSINKALLLQDRDDFALLYFSENSALWMRDRGKGNKDKDEAGTGTQADKHKSAPPSFKLIDPWRISKESFIKWMQGENFERFAKELELLLRLAPESKMAATLLKTARNYPKLSEEQKSRLAGMGE